MPYGLPKNIGGDSKENVRWMEDCIKSIKNKNPDYSKERAIRICKKALIKQKGNKNQAGVQVMFDVLDTIE